MLTIFFVQNAVLYGVIITSAKASGLTGARHILMAEKYKIFLADPPWNYNDKAAAGARGASFKYPTLTLDELGSLLVRGHLVRDLADDNSILFLWSTFPMMPEALALCHLWGFKYKTLGFNWIKKNKSGSIFLGMGHYTRSNPEVCLIAVRGSPPIKDHSISSVIFSERMRHSQKPAIHKLIERLCGRRKRIELFARARVAGWDYFGNQLVKSQP